MGENTPTFFINLLTNPGKEVYNIGEVINMPTLILLIVIALVILIEVRNYQANKKIEEMKKYIDSLQMKQMQIEQKLKENE